LKSGISERPKLAAVLIALAVFALAVAVVFALFRFVVRRETQPTPQREAGTSQSMKVR
jgi:flagellar basal body-associated protein FliL